MEKLLDWAGGASAVVGIVFCVASGVSGQYYLGGYDCEDLFVVGTAGMVFGCLARLYRSSVASAGI